MSQVYLVGFMGAGKSTVGRLLAARTGRPFVDLDEAIVREAASPVAAIFASRGEAGFRELEHAALRRVAAGEDAVVACGGGIVTDEGSRALLARGTVVYLTATCDEALARVSAHRAERPLLSGSDPQPERLLASREPLYQAMADVSVSTSGRSAAEVAEAIAESLRTGAAPDEPAACVSVPGGAYDVRVGDGLLDRLGSLLAARTDSRRCAVVTDETVRGLFADRACASLRDAGFETDVLSVPAGEASKSWSTAGDLLARFSDAGLGRDALVVALGGGVVGDLAGFCAATYLRGIPVVQVPTTLLAQADSSIGGKTGVDLPRGKNLVGAFWQPLLVLSDTALLASLPEAEWASGLAEVAKSAVLASLAAVERLEMDAAALAERSPDAVRRAVRGAATFKARVVSGDEREAADRECLNLGHTFGHALERVLGFGTIAHGAAVADGMRFAARLAERAVGAPAEWTQRQDRLLDSLALSRTATACDPHALLEAMRADKKVRAGRVRFVLSEAPGSWRVERVDEHDIEALLLQWCS